MCPPNWIFTTFKSTAREGNMQNEKRKQGEIEAVNDTEMVRFIKYLHRHSSLVSLLKWGL